MGQSGGIARSAVSYGRQTQEPIGKQRRTMADRKRIAAFAIDEHLRWATAEVTANTIRPGSMVAGQEIEVTTDGVIANQVKDYIARMADAHPEIRHAARIGISTIGAVDLRTKQVWQVARKSWSPARPELPLLDFAALLPRSARGTPTYNDYAVQNDATCAALAESYFRAEDTAHDHDWLYITVGHGVNCGVVRFRRSLFRLAHPEMGHVFPRLHPVDPFIPELHSTCKRHGCCYEGMASGGSLEKRWGSDWTSNPKAWGLEAFYIAQLCLTGMLAFSPDRILLGGYVTRMNDRFVGMVRKEFAVLNAGYIQSAQTKSLREYIVPARFGDDASLRGALVLAAQAGEPGALGVIDGDRT